MHSIGPKCDECPDCVTGPNACSSFGYDSCPAATATAETGGGGSVNKDPHVQFPHGGRADFRGEDLAYYIFHSSRNVSFSVMTQLAYFETLGKMQLHVNGSFLTQ